MTSITSSEGLGLAVPQKTESRPLAPPDLRWRRPLAFLFDLIYTTWARSMLAAFPISLGFGLTLVTTQFLLSPFVRTIPLHARDVPPPVMGVLAGLAILGGFASRDWVPRGRGFPSREWLLGLSGKEVFRMRVVDHEHGRPVTLRRSIERNLPFLFPPLWPALAWQSLQGDGRHLVDLQASTRVVHVSECPRQAGGESPFSKPAAPRRG